MLSVLWICLCACTCVLPATVQHTRSAGHAYRLNVTKRQGMLLFVFDHKHISTMSNVLAGVWRSLLGQGRFVPGPVVHSAHVTVAAWRSELSNGTRTAEAPALFAFHWAGRPPVWGVHRTAASTAWCCWASRPTSKRVTHGCNCKLSKLLHRMGSGLAPYVLMDVHMGSLLPFGAMMHELPRFMWYTCMTYTCETELCNLEDGIKHAWRTPGSSYICVVRV